MLPSRFNSTETPSLLRAYGVVFISVLIALLLRLALEQFVHLEGLYIFFITSIVVSSWYGGPVPGLVAMLLSAVAILFFFTSPSHSFLVNGVSEVVWLGLFVLEGIVIIGLNLLHRWTKAGLQDSNRRISNLINSISDGFFAVDRQWRLTYLNRRFAQLTGQSPENLIGMNLWDVFPEAVGTTSEREYQGALQSGKAAHFEEFLAPLNIWFEVHAYPSDEGLSVFFQVINERKQAEQERIRLLEREQAARREAERVQQRLEFLVQAGRTLASSLDYKTTLDNLARLTIPALADWCVIDIVEEDGRISRLAMAHVDPTKEQLLQELKQRYQLDHHSTAPSLKVVADGKARLWTEIDQEQIARHSRDSDHFNLIVQLGACSMIAVPMITRDTIIGVITLVCGPSGRRYDNDDLTLADVLSRRAALAVDNARLYRNIQLSQSSASELAGRATFLSEVSRILTTMLDNETALVDVAQLVVDFLSDWCLIDLLQENGQIQRIGASSTSLTWNGAETPLPSQGTWSAVISPLIAEVVRTGRSEFYPELPDALAASFVAEIQTTPIVQDSRPQSALIVPLRARGRILGALICVSMSPDLQYDLDDLTLTEELAYRIALAIENTQLYRELQAAVRIRDEFLSIASHELKTPLTSLLGYSRLLQSLTDNYGLNEREKRGIRIIAEQSDRLNKLINALLDISRIRMGRLTIEHQNVDLTVLVQRVVEETQIVLERHTLRVQQTPSPLMINGDMLRLQQVVQNLIDNAIKYSPDGGEIIVQLEQQDMWACIKVTDQGIGIPEEARSRLFQPFYRAANTLTLQISGAGIGLYVVKEIVTLHNGTVDVMSQEGFGSTFIIRLPLAQDTIGT